MEILLSQEALHELRQRGKVLTIFQGEYSGCCVGKVPALMADARRPLEQLEQYELFQVEDVKIYLDKKIIGAINGLKIDIQGLWKLKNWTVTPTTTR
ncbi:hypothetical protein SAMN02745885_01525 [Carboxydocella sporoproducens DSM 16521]|uniref:Fe-S cluster assembly iron-binding protein IscA n=2 Tax=Carboxydocella TaxID=178898 RepID=A0A1T4Q5D2_9FIRM|nr:MULTISPECIES: CC/Se motif family (seleno)protein [Carboxydocella]AVX21159.1 hypothetical protein CFE_1993 [Carboxydocella thermautotrophica]AVX31594.1 hypothetical protein CTH_2029 [Carboxydocella thermautotrophica]SJZ98741.1 hypothetical protein SAMN02745885_01525 [Carboxydocella sporoproducens DSM 16521]